MDIKELMKTMVTSESQDERMEIAEQIMEMMNTESQDPGVDVEAMQASLDELNTTVADLQEQLAGQKQKYIDRFFSGSDEEPEEEKEEEKPITTDDIVKQLGEGK